MRAENPKTFEELRNRLHGDAAAELKPPTGAWCDANRDVAIEAHEAYQTSEGRDHHEDAIITGLVYLASKRSGSGSHMPFARALDEILAEVREVS